MSKSFILVDTPENGCQSCTFSLTENHPYAFCSITMRDIDKDEEYKKPKQCPLRPLPERRDLEGKQDIMEWFENFGWNHCLHVILGWEEPDGQGDGLVSGGRKYCEEPTAEEFRKCYKQEDFQKSISGGQRKEEQNG